jgi:hypothetical protein
MATRKRLITGVTMAVMLAVGTMGVGVADANSHPTQQGLVNVYADDVNVQIPVAVAANICGVAVNVLVSEINQGAVDCEVEGVAIAQNERGNNGGPAPRQEGLVNVALTDINVQVPVAVAANICGVAVNVLAQNVEQGGVDCEAIAESGANN